ncbi:MAG: hypothetical protein RR922_00320 [Clostridia bacterium]
MNNIGVNKFEVVDLPGMKTIAFVADRSYNMGQDTKEPIFSLEKIENSTAIENGENKKIFSVVNANRDEQFIVLLTLCDNKAYLNTGVLSEKGFEKSDEVLPLAYGTVYNQDAIEYKEYTYASSLKRHFSIIDTQTAEEVKPTLFVEEVTKVLKGRYKLLPYRPYIVLELRVE